MLGLFQAFKENTADVTDRAGALKAIIRCAANLTIGTSIPDDGRYSGQPFANAVHEQVGTTARVANRNELHTFE